MIRVRPASERGHADHGWLDTRHSFSFADYRDPEHMGFRSLRVLNEDWIQPGAGFPTHPHRDMEILTFVFEGELEHRDSLGNGSVIRPGDVQRMTAGTGVLHSERNPSREIATHLLQVWILPERRGLEPGYEQRSFADATSQDPFRLVASPDGRADSITVHQDAFVHVGRWAEPASLSHSLAPGRHAWLQVVRGRIRASDRTLETGDGLAVSDEGELQLEVAGDSEILLFDLA